MLDSLRLSQTILQPNDPRRNTRKQLVAMILLTVEDGHTLQIN